MAKVINATCERCKQVCPCRFHGTASNVDDDKAQNGEWLCEPCVPLRIKELDDAIARMKETMSKWD